MSGAAVATIILKRNNSRRAAAEESRAAAEESRPSGSPLKAALHSGEVCVNLRAVLRDTDRFASIKGFVFYAMYFGFFFAFHFLRFDVAEAQSTFSWYPSAISSGFDLVVDSSVGWCLPNVLGAGNALDCYTPFVNMATTDDLARFVTYDITHYIRGINQYCPNCQIAMTVSDDDLTQMGLHSFICTDFEVLPSPASQAVDRLDVLSRDCTAVDAAYAASPSSKQTPCCRSAELFKASLALKISTFVGGVSAAPLAALLDETIIARAAKLYVNATLDPSGSGGLAQIVIRRDTHFVGVAYSAQHTDRDWLPDFVNPSVRYWSRWYAPAGEPTDTTLIAFAIAGFILSTAHELLDLGACNLELSELGHSLGQPYVLLVWLPTIVMPWLLTGITHLMRSSDVPAVITAVELVMFVRLFNEGQALGPFRVIVLTLASASRQLLTLCATLVLSIALLSAMNAQLSGSFDGTNAPYSSAFNAGFDVVVQGAPLGGANFDHFPEISTLMYYVLNVFLYLILAQFFIAILVGAFDDTRTAEQEMREDCGLPAGFRSVAVPQTWAQWAWEGLEYMGAYVRHGRWALLLRRDLERLLRGAEATMRELAEAEGVPYEQRPLMLPASQLHQALGPHAAACLVRRYGAEVVAARRQDAMTLSPLPNRPRTAPSPVGPTKAELHAGEGEGEGGEEAAALAARRRARAQARAGAVGPGELRSGPAFDSIAEAESATDAGLRPNGQSEWLADDASAAAADPNVVPTGRVRVRSQRRRKAAENAPAPAEHVQIDVRED